MLGVEEKKKKNWRINVNIMSVVLEQRCLYYDEYFCDYHEKSTQIEKMTRIHPHFF